MNCLNCGNPIPEEAKFCPVCGTPVPTDSVAEAVAEPVVEAEAAPAVQDAPTESWYQSSAQQNVPPVTPVFVSSKPTIGSIFDFYRKAFSVLAKKPIRLWGLSLLYFFIASIVSSLGSLVPLISLPIVLVLGLGFTGVLLDGYHGKDVRSEQLFQGFHNFLARRGRPQRRRHVLDGTVDADLGFCPGHEYHQGLFLQLCPLHPAD